MSRNSVERQEYEWKEVPWQELERRVFKLQKRIYRAAQEGNKQKVRTREEKRKMTIVRYADDFVVMHDDRSMIERAKGVISDWLKGIGLELKAEKTRISHTLEGENPGFDFLGFNIRQYVVGKYRSGKSTHGTPLGFKTLIKPSSKSIRKHKERLSQIVRSHKSAPQAALIAKLNPVIRGWCNYFKTVISKKTYNDMDNYLWELLWQWAKGRHPNKSIKWIARNYWTLTKDVWWNFIGKTKYKEKIELTQHSKTEIIRHVKVKGTASPYNGDLVVRFV